MIPLPNEEATPPVTKIYFVSPTTNVVLYDYLLRMRSFMNKTQNGAKLKKKKNKDPFVMNKL